jgi:hypothetical protein
MFPWNRINGSLDMIPKRTTSHHREKEQQIAPQWSPSPRRAEAVVRWDQVEAARKKEFITSLHDQMEEQERRRQVRLLHDEHHCSIILSTLDHSR